LLSITTFKRSCKVNNFRLLLLDNYCRFVVFLAVNNSLYSIQHISEFGTLYWTITDTTIIYVHNLKMS